MNLLIGLLTPLSIGLADHFGTDVGRRGRLLAFVTWIYIFTLLSSLVLAIVLGGSPTPVDLVLGGLSGGFAGLGLARLYRGYTTHGVGIVGPVAAVTGAIVPICVDTLLTGLPSLTVGAGMAFGLGGVWLIGAPRRGAAWDRGAVRHGLISGSLFGITTSLLGSTGEAAGIWPVVPGRVMAIATLIALARVYHESLIPRPGVIRWAALIGTLSAIGLGSFVLAASVNLAVAGLFFQMSFGATVLFRVIFAGETTSPAQRAGFGVATLSLAMMILG